MHNRPSFPGDGKAAACAPPGGMRGVSALGDIPASPETCPGGTRQPSFHLGRRQAGLTPPAVYMARPGSRQLHRRTRAHTPTVTLALGTSIQSDLLGYDR